MPPSPTSWPLAFRVQRVVFPSTRASATSPPTSIACGSASFGHVSPSPSLISGPRIAYGPGSGKGSAGASFPGCSLRASPCSSPSWPRHGRHCVHRTGAIGQWRRYRRRSLLFSSTGGWLSTICLRSSMKKRRLWRPWQRPSSIGWTGGTSSAKGYPWQQRPRQLQPRLRQPLPLSLSGRRKRRPSGGKQSCYMIKTGGPIVLWRGSWHWFELTLKLMFV